MLYLNLFPYRYKKIIHFVNLLSFMNLAEGHCTSRLLSCVCRLKIYLNLCFFCVIKTLYATSLKNMYVGVVFVMVFTDATKWSFGAGLWL
jgi:hypothetical protein